MTNEIHAGNLIKQKKYREGYGKEYIFIQMTAISDCIPSK